MVTVTAFFTFSATFSTSSMSIRDVGCSVVSSPPGLLAAGMSTTHTCGGAVADEWDEAPR